MPSPRVPSPRTLHITTEATNSTPM
jgi:hypothetical protein